MFAAKFRSKRGKYNNSINFIFAEIFTFMTMDVKAYLPAIHTVTIYFLKDLITGKKKFVPMAGVVHVHVRFCGAGSCSFRRDVIIIRRAGLVTVCEVVQILLAPFTKTTIAIA